jgi:nucleotide-binding universal stress UspA family protein
MVSSICAVETEKIKQMKKILVPTDFSDTAKDAFRYACQLAGQYESAHLKVIHAYTPEVEADYPNIVPPVTELLEARKEMLNNFLKSCTPAANTTVESDIIVGFAVEEICAASEKFDFVVMGTTGESGILEKVFGSISNSTSRKACCPVILVPKGHQFSGFNHVLYASNYESAEDDMVEQIIDFNDAFKATVHFVHVRDDHDKENFDKTKEEIFEELFEDGEPSFAFEIEEVHAESVSEGLNQYALNHNIDLVVMVNKKRTWWERWFNPSQTRSMAFATHTPMMVLHLNDD